MAGSTAGASAGPPGSINLTLTSGGRSAGPSAGGVCRDHYDNIQTQYWEMGYTFPHHWNTLSHTGKG